MLLNRIQPWIESILRKNQKGFRQGRSVSSQILTIRRILEGARNNHFSAVLLFVNFAKAFDSIHREKMREILLAYKIPHEIVGAVMILYKNSSALVRSPDGDTDLFDVKAGVLQGDTLAPYIFIICLAYILRTAIDLINKHVLTLKSRLSKRLSSNLITDADYTNNLALFSDTIAGATALFHTLEKVASTIGLH